MPPLVPSVGVCERGMERGGMERGGMERDYFIAAQLTMKSSALQRSQQRSEVTVEVRGHSRWACV